MAEMSDAEWLLVQRQIAAQIDYPSVYMGGPSPRAMKLAEKIMQALEAGYRLRPTNCGHGSWESYRAHGIYCPTCGMAFRAAENETDAALTK